MGFNSGFKGLNYILFLHVHFIHFLQKNAYKDQGSVVSTMKKHSTVSLNKE